MRYFERVVGLGGWNEAFLAVVDLGVFFLVAMALAGLVVSVA